MAGHFALRWSRGGLTCHCPDRAGPGSAGPRSRTWRILAWVSVVAAAALVAATLGVYGLYLQLNGNIKH